MVKFLMYLERRVTGLLIEQDARCKERKRYTIPYFQTLAMGKSAIKMPFTEMEESLGNFFVCLSICSW